MANDKYPFYLGQHTRTVSTQSSEAQAWFNLGLNWALGFNHEEAVVCFKKSLDADPNCVMSHWGVAYASGPFYNLVWREVGDKEAARMITQAIEHIELGRKLAAHGTRLDNLLVEAVAFRFQEHHPASPETYDKWDVDYVAAMRKVHDEFPNDHDVMALLVEALITRTPRRLWDIKTGLPSPGTDTVEAMNLCKRSMALNTANNHPQHPGILHLHIHTMEMSHTPEDALPSADTLTALCRDAGHLNHMPGHIYMLCGQYAKAKAASELAIAADDAYCAYAGSQNFYVTAHCHDIHLMIYACMFLGQYEPAAKAATAMRKILTREVLTIKDRPKLASVTEGYYAMTNHVLVRFGKWHDIINMPAPDDAELFPLIMAMHHYSRGVAFSSLKRTEEAETELVRFHECVERIPPTRRLLNNQAHDILAVGESLLNGELAYHKGQYDVAYAHLREAVDRDDNLKYNEPWAWMHPPRHALAALLLAQGHVDEAERVYRDDLGLTRVLQRCSQHGGNIWSLRGLAECLERRGAVEELDALRAQLETAEGQADVTIESSCMCRT